MRNTKAFRATFNLRARPTPAAVDPLPDLSLPPLSTKSDHPVAKSTKALQAVPPVAAQILNPVYRRTALVKLQGPFTDRQLDSVCKGLVYLEKLGLVSVIVVELDDWIRGDDGEKVAVTNEVNRVVSALESQGARARPILQSVVRLGPKPLDTPLPENSLAENNEIPVPEAHTLPHDLNTIRSTLHAGEIPVLPRSRWTLSAERCAYTQTMSLARWPRAWSRPEMHQSTLRKRVPMTWTSRHCA